MAFVTTIYCHTCKESKREVLDRNNPYECGACAQIKLSAKEREWKAGREGLTIEERLRYIENFIYHHKESRDISSIVYG